MPAWKHWWQRVPVPIRKPLVLIIGTVVVAAGIILLPLPGPGWAVIFLGFAFLATEFTFAVKTRDWLINLLKKLVGWLLAGWHRFWKHSKHKR